MNRSPYVALTAAALLIAGLTACNREPVATTNPSPASTPDVTPPGPIAQGTPTDAGRSIAEAVGDATITTKVKTALIADPTVKATDVNVDTNQGVVKLTGLVADQAQIDRAEQIAREVEGIVNVDNNLRVRSS